MSSFRIVAAFLISAVLAVAQPPGRGPRGAALGHIHLNSAHPDAAISFWTDVIGASAYSRESLNGVTTIGALILFTPTDPHGPSTGTNIDRIGLRVPDFQPIVDRLAKTGYKSFRPAGGDQLMIDGPDGVRIELKEDSSMYAPLEFDHVYLCSAHSNDMQAWYSRLFGRVAGTALTFTQADSALPTAGRAIDHIAFEVKDLQSFCEKLAADGIKFDSPYRSIPELRMSSAFLTDPWGTRIELTEGLSN